MWRSAVFGLFALFLIIVLAPASALALRCGDRLVSIGDTKADVMMKCGSPQWEDSWQEKRIAQGYDTTYPTSGHYPHISPGLTVIYVTIDEWTYNFGPNSFIRTLRFENNRLVAIQTGQYGY